jgi:hypothetical protein
MNITFVGTLDGDASNGGLALPYQAYGQYFVYLQMNLDGTSGTNGQGVDIVVMPSTDSANVYQAAYKTYTNYTTGVYNGSSTFMNTCIHTYSPANKLRYLYFYVGLGNLISRPFSEDTQYSYINVIQI